MARISSILSESDFDSSLIVDASSFVNLESGGPRRFSLRMQNVRRADSCFEQVAREGDAMAQGTTLHFADFH